MNHTLVTLLVPSEMACLASSPGKIRRTDVWISRDEMVDFLEYEASSKKWPCQETIQDCCTVKTYSMPRWRSAQRCR